MNRRFIKNLVSRGADIELTPGAVVAGGNVEVIDDDGVLYAYHTFDESQNIIVDESGVIQIVLIAGGGGRESTAGPGGGGAGGVVITNKFVGQSSYPLVIGAGGVGTTNGDDSTFLDEVAIGGGFGAVGNAGSGGSGGGDTGGTSTAGSGTPPQGNDGGEGRFLTGNRRLGGGGGGYNEPGHDSVGTTTGDGGDGLEWPTGSGQFHAGGGGGSANEDPPGTNGLGGGPTNYGGGAGPEGIVGGDGVLFIRYPIEIEPIQTTPIPTQNIDQLKVIDLNSFFSNPIELTYSIISIDNQVVSGSIVDDYYLRLLGNSLSTGSVTVQANVSTETAQTTFDVNVVEIFDGTRIINTAIQFQEDQNQYIDYGAIFPSGAFSAEAWVDTDSLNVNSDNVLFGIGSGSANDLILYPHTSTGSAVNQPLLDVLGNELLAPESVIGTGWRHFAVSRSEVNNLSWYIDGSLIQSIEISGSLSPEFRIGSYIGNPGASLTGSVADVRLFNNHRTVNEINDRIENRLTGNELGLIGYWPFYNDTGSIVVDESGNNNDGTLVNNPIFDQFGITQLVQPLTDVTQSAVAPYQVELSGSFTNVEEYEASSSSPGDTLTISGSILTISPSAAGTSTITVTSLSPAPIPTGSSASTSFTATVGDANATEKSNISSVTFDGVNDYIEVPYSSIHDFTTEDITIHVVIKQGAKSTDFRKLLTKGDGSLGTSYAVQMMSNDHARVSVKGISNVLESTSPIPKDEFVGITAVIDQTNSEARLYINGQLDNTATGVSYTGLDNGNDPIRIGAETAASNQYYEGLIDEVQLWDKALSAAEIAEFGNKVLNGSETNLVSYWNFEDRSPTQATDVASGANGTFQGGASYAYDAFDFDYALELDGVNDYVSVPHSPLLSPPQITFELMMKFNANGPSYSRILHKINDYQILTNDTGAPRPWLRLNGGFTGGTDLFRGTTAPLSLNEVYHIAYTVDLTGGVANMYINGVNVDSDTFAGFTPSSTGPLEIGRGENRYVPGTIKYLRIWDTLRTQREIQLNMNKELTGNEAGLVGYWKFDDLSDPGVAVDSSPNGNDGVING